ncbi:uncharacterized protein LOC116601482 [Nematostella vectensis]|uniref:uncharacterized protein LOC116601482 n=1 Tax=Nematostella vectensis TaxID=45351 RepID=UPI0020773290|nr:uncharacterized protein LOC116601482 [Nematostella vectensis]
MHSRVGSQSLWFSTTGLRWGLRWNTIEAMKVIGAGLPKTGTKSLAAALRHLGYTVHDIREHWKHHCEEYNAAFEGEIPDFKEMYKNIDATTDGPSCYFHKEIFKAFPDSKVILTVRKDEETRRKSLQKNIDVIEPILDSPVTKLCRYLTPTGRKWGRLLSHQRIMDEIDYQKYNDNVIASIPANQLLVFYPEEGWEPLCAFLGVEVPDISYPRANVGSADISSMFRNSWSLRRAKQELAVFITLLVALVAFAFVLIVPPI